VTRDDDACSQVCVEDSRVPSCQTGCCRLGFDGGPDIARKNLYNTIHALWSSGCPPDAVRLTGLPNRPSLLSAKGRKIVLKETPGILLVSSGSESGGQGSGRSVVGYGGVGSSDRRLNSAVSLFPDKNGVAPGILLLPFKHFKIALATKSSG
jgi:hypothetical protein